MNQDWILLQELKNKFHENISSRKDVNTKDYWQDEKLLVLYDKYFAERIGWKWEAVWSQIKEEFWEVWSSQSFSSVLDFGCGTGVAGRRFFKEWFSRCSDSNNASASTSFSNLTWKIFDRSSLAQKFAENKNSELLKTSTNNFSEINISCIKNLQEINSIDLVLVSHVLNEMDQKAQLSFAQFLKDHAKMFLMVESGDPSSSKNLVRFKDSMRDDFAVLKPCPHQNLCPLEQKEIFNKDWCHFFAKSPSYASQSAEWREFAKVMNLDLRRQSLSFTWMIHKTLSQDILKKDLDLKSVIGLSLKHKAGMQIMECNESEILKNKVISKKKHPKNIMDALSDQKQWFI